MVQIINPSPRAMQAGDIGRALGMGVNQFTQSNLDEKAKQLQMMGQQQQQGQLANALFGENGNQFASLPLDAQLKIAQMQSQQQMQQQKSMQAQQQEQQKIQEKVAPIQQAFGTVNRMRDIGANGNLGRGSSFKGAFGGDTAKDRAEYEQLGKSLISLSTNIPIRNRIEFETLAEKLYDPSLPDKAREGVLDAMERILNNSMAQFVGPQNMQQNANNGLEQSQKERPPLDSFFKK